MIAVSLWHLSSYFKVFQVAVPCVKEKNSGDDTARFPFQICVVTMRAIMGADCN